MAFQIDARLTSQYSPIVCFEPSCTVQYADKAGGSYGPVVAPLTWTYIRALIYIKAFTLSGSTTGPEFYLQDDNGNVCGASVYGIKQSIPSGGVNGQLLEVFGFTPMVFATQWTLTAIPHGSSTVTFDALVQMR